MKSSEISKILNIPVSTLHYYEEAGLLIPDRTKNGYREYQQRDIETMKFILFFKDMQFSLNDIQMILTQFQRLNTYKNLVEYDEATSFFLEKKREFQQSIEIYQFAISIIDTIFKNQHKDCSKEEKEALIQQIQQLIDQFWQLKSDSLAMTK